MTRKTKGRNGGDRATPKTTDSCHSKPTASRVKGAFVRLAAMLATFFRGLA